MRAATLLDHVMQIGDDITSFVCNGGGNATAVFKIGSSGLIGLALVRPLGNQDRLIEVVHGSRSFSAFSPQRRSLRQVPNSKPRTPLPPLTSATALLISKCLFRARGLLPVRPDG